MTSRTITPPTARHAIKLVDGVECLRIPNRRNWFVLLFLLVWLTGWGWGGISALRQIAENFDLFLLVWLCFWAIALIFAGSTVAAQIAGAEVIQVTGGNLVVSRGVGTLRRVWRYDGGSIRNLMPWTPDSLADRMFAGRGLDRPFFLLPRTGAVRFDYGAATLFLAADADEPEGRTIVEWLARRLPLSATAIE